MKGMSIVTNHNFYKKGLFLRNPIQKIQYDVMTYDNDVNNAYQWIDTAKKKVIPYLLNWNKFKKISNFIHLENAGCIYVNELRNPLYFERKGRELKCIITDETHPVYEVYSWGYEWEWESCSGYCVKEMTIITFRDGRKHHTTNYGKYKWTYEHIVMDFIKSQK